MKISEIDINELKPYDKNAKKHPQKQVDLLAKSIERFGFTTPLLINENNEVIAGHGRLLALKQLNRTKANVVRLEGLSKSEVKALRLADNKIAEMGEWDMDLAIGELKELDNELLNLTGFAAEKTGRICYGMELDPKYVDVIIKRWEDYTGQKAIKVV